MTSMICYTLAQGPESNWQTPVATHRSHNSWKGRYRRWGWGRWHHCDIRVWMCSATSTPLFITANGSLLQASYTGWETAEIDRNPLLRNPKWCPIPSVFADRRSGPMTPCNTVDRTIPINSTAEQTSVASAIVMGTWYWSYSSSRAQPRHRRMD